MLMPDLKERARTLEELAGSAAFAAHEELPAIDEKALAALTPEARARLADLAEFLSAAPWEKADLEHWLRDYAEVKEVKLKDIAQPLRAALCGSLTSPPINAVLWALGRDESLLRIMAAAGAGTVIEG
jgi:glutamyl-tRNA synthetase